MAVDFKSLSSSKLQQLRGKQTISISWRADKGSPSQVVLDAYPKNVAFAFCKKVEAQLVPATKTQLGNISAIPGNIFTVTGGCPAACSQILKWALSCCDGRGVKEFPKDEKATMWGTVKLIEVAEELEVPGLADVLCRRLTAITKTLLSINDVNKVCACYSAESEYGQIIVKNIGTAIFNKQLNLETNCAVFRENFPEYDSQLSVFLEEKKNELVTNVEVDSNIAPFPKAQKKSGLRNVKGPARQLAVEAKQAEHFKEKEARAKVRRAEEHELWRQQINEARAAQRRQSKKASAIRTRNQAPVARSSSNSQSAPKPIPKRSDIPPRFAEDSSLRYSTRNFFAPNSTPAKNQMNASKTSAPPTSPDKKTDKDSSNSKRDNETPECTEKDDEKKVEITFMESDGTCAVVPDKLIVAHLKTNEAEPRSEKLDWAEDATESAEIEGADA